MTDSATNITSGFGEVAKVWFKIGCINLGGAADQIALMHRVLVDEKKWIDEPRFMHALNYCMMLPGREAQQLATYVGWSLHGLRGGLVAGLLFIPPGVRERCRARRIAAGCGLHSRSLGLFFSKLAVVSFGGAYALPACMSQQVAEARHWLAPREMVDALGIAARLVIGRRISGFNPAPSCSRKPASE
jgi:chromate transporter